MGKDVVFAGLQPAGLERYPSDADAFVRLSEFETFGLMVLRQWRRGFQ